jgi:hypothetical protein
MTHEEKKMTISQIKLIKNWLRHYGEYKCYVRTEPRESFSYLELIARWFRRNNHKVELSYGTLSSERNCYITIHRKLK